MFLTEEELSILEEKDLGIARLDRVRDVFLCCCYTGLAYIDVYNLKEDHIVKDINGKKWIHIKRAKTGTMSRIRLLSKAETILHKYHDLPKEDGRLLPVPSNQKVNAFLKEIATLCGIEKKLTSHVARHTFATHLLNKGVSMDSIRHQLGQKSLGQTQHYAELLGETVAREMEEFEQKDNRAKRVN